MFVFNICCSAIIILCYAEAVEVEPSDPVLLAAKNENNFEFVFLGCFVNWQKSDKFEDYQVTHLSKLVSSNENESCNSICLKKEKKNRLVLKRGDLCKCSHWDSLITEPPDFYQVPLKYCDLPCLIGNTEAVGLCGGSFFYSLSCNKLVNKLSENANSTDDDCSIPQNIPFEPDLNIPKINVNEVEQIQICNADLNGLSNVIKTYLPIVNSNLCAQYCLTRQKYTVSNINNANLFIGTKSSTDESASWKNCYCVDRQDILNRNTTCNKDASHLSFYKLNPDNNIQNDIVLTKLDMEEDNHYQWEIDCIYYKYISDVINCGLDYNPTPDLRGIWSSCNKIQCSMTYRPAQDENPKNVSIRYYLNNTEKAFADVSVQTLNEADVTDETDCPKISTVGVHECNVSLAESSNKILEIQIFLKVPPSPRKNHLLIDIITINGSKTPQTPYTDPTQTTDAITTETHSTTSEPYTSPFTPTTTEQGSTTTKPETSASTSPTTTINPETSTTPSTTFVTTILTTNEITSSPTMDPIPSTYLNDGLYHVILDTKEDLNTTNWEQDLRCVYKEYIAEFNCYYTAAKFPQTANNSKNSIGYWSNCLNKSCVLYYPVPESHVATSLELYSCATNGNPMTGLEVTFQYNGVNQTHKLATVKGCFFYKIGFPDLVYGDILFVNQSSAGDGAFIVIDKIVIKSKIQSSLPPTTVSTTAPPAECSNSVKCNATDHRGVQWSICPGKTQIQNCPGSSRGSASWGCSMLGIFDPHSPDYRGCSSEWVSKMEVEVELEEIIVLDKAREFLQEIERVTEEKQHNILYFGHELKKILQLSQTVLKNLINNTELEDVENLASIAVSVSQNILVNDRPWQDLNESEKIDAGTYYLESLEKKAFQLTSRVPIQNDTQFKDYVKNFDDFKELLATAGKLVPNEMEIFFPAKGVSNDESYIKLPPNWVNSIADLPTVDFVGIRINSNYANSIFLPNGVQISKILNGDLMSFTFQNPGGKMLMRGIHFNETGVRIRFKHNVSAWGDEVKNHRRKLHSKSGERAKAVLGTKDPCVYWNITELNWSNTGCKLVKRDSLHTLCECNHLTSFAVLMDVHNYVGKDKALELLTWILTPISSICLIICIGVYSMSSVKAIRSPRGVITNHLCICLLVGNILLLVFVDRDYIYLSQGFCTTFGILAHYFFLSAFFWMAFEGYVLYKVVIIVFDDGKDRFTMQYAVAYGTPGLIVLVTGLTAISQGDDAYESDMFCWLSGQYIWAFVGPIAAIILGNFVMLIISMRKASNLSRNPTIGTKRHTKAFFTWLKGSAGLTVLLGITWGFGFFMIVENSTISNTAAYLFTVLNASQGIFLFIFHILMNEKIRGTLTRKFAICCNNTPFLQSQRTTTHSSSTRAHADSNTKLTFRTAFSRKKRKIQKYFTTEPKFFKDNIMPESEISTKSKNTLNVSQRCNTITSE